MKTKFSEYVYRDIIVYQSGLCPTQSVSLVSDSSIIVAAAPEGAVPIT